MPEIVWGFSGASLLIIETLIEKNIHILENFKENRVEKQNYLQLSGTIMSIFKYLLQGSPGGDGEGVQVCLSMLFPILSMKQIGNK